MSPLSIRVSRISSLSRDFSHCEARVISDFVMPLAPDARMIAFSRWYTPAQVEAVRGYVGSQAKKLQALEAAGGK